jgi:uncharacterized protein
LKVTGYSKIAMGVAALAVVVYGVLCALLYLSQDRLLYFPTPESSHPQARDLRLKSDGAIVKVWELHPNAPGALIYFGGNGDDVAEYLEEFDTAFPNRAIYLMNYRGYGGSTGSPSERALISDAEIAYDWIAARHDHITVIGRSLGTGIAIALATRRPVERLVLTTPYDSVANVAAERFPWFPVRWLIKDPYDSVSRIGKVRSPVLVLIAERDEVISRQRSAALIAAIPPGLGRVVIIPNAGHGDIVSFPAYARAVKEFVSPALVAQ